MHRQAAASPAPRGLAALGPARALQRLRDRGLDAQPITLPHPQPQPKPAADRDPLFDLATGRAVAQPASLRPPPAAPAATDPQDPDDPHGCLALPRERCGRHPDGAGCSWSWWYGKCLPDDVYQGIGLTGFKTERARAFIAARVDSPMSRVLAKVGTKAAAVLAAIIEYTGASLPGLATLIEAMPTSITDLFGAIRSAASHVTSHAAGLGADTIKTLLGEWAGSIGAPLLDLCINFLGKYLAVTTAVAATALLDAFVDELDALVARHMTPGSLAHGAATTVTGAVRWTAVLLVAAVAATAATGVGATAAAGGVVPWAAWAFFAGITLAGRKWGLDLVKHPLQLFTTATQSLSSLVFSTMGAAASGAHTAVEAATNIEHVEQDKAAASAARVRLHDLETSGAISPGAAASLRERFRGAEDDLAELSAEADAARAETGSVPTDLVVRVHAATIAMQAAIAAELRAHAPRLEARLREATRQLADIQSRAHPDHATVRKLRSEIDAAVGALARTARELPAPGAAFPADTRQRGPGKPALAMAFHHVSSSLLARAGELDRVIKRATRERTEAETELQRSHEAIDDIVSAVASRAGVGPQALNGVRRARTDAEFLREAGAFLKEHGKHLEGEELETFASHRSRSGAWCNVMGKTHALLGRDPASAGRDLAEAQHQLKVAKSFLLQSRVGDKGAASAVARTIGTTPRAMFVLAERLASRAWRATVPGGPTLLDLEDGFRRLADAGLVAGHELLQLVADARDAEQLASGIAPRDTSRDATLQAPLDHSLASFAYGMLAASREHDHLVDAADYAYRSGDPVVGLRARAAALVRASPRLRRAADQSRKAADKALAGDSTRSASSRETHFQSDPLPQVGAAAESIAAALGGRALGDALVSMARGDVDATEAALRELRGVFAEQGPKSRGAVAAEIFLDEPFKSSRTAATRAEALEQHLDSAQLSRAVTRAVARLMTRVVTTGSAGAVIREAGKAALRRGPEDVDPAEMLAHATDDALAAGSVAGGTSHSADGPLLGGPHARRVLSAQRHSWNAAVHDHADEGRPHVALPVLVVGLMHRALEL